MASARRPDGRSGLDAVLRLLRRRPILPRGGAPLAASTPRRPFAPPLDSATLAVRPPWWLAARRLLSGRLLSRLLGRRGVEFGASVQSRAPSQPRSTGYGTPADQGLLRRRPALLPGRPALMWRPRRGVDDRADPSRSNGGRPAAHRASRRPPLLPRTTPAPLARGWRAEDASAQERRPVRQVMPPPGLPAKPMTAVRRGAVPVAVPRSGASKAAVEQLPRADEACKQVPTADEPATARIGILTGAGPSAGGLPPQPIRTFGRGSGRQEPLGRNNPVRRSRSSAGDGDALGLRTVLTRSTAGLGSNAVRMRLTRLPWLGRMTTAHSGQPGRPSTMVGPEVSAPRRASELRVLGGPVAPAPHSGFDPAAAVAVTAPHPAPTGWRMTGSGIGSASGTQASAHASSRPSSAVERWRAAVAARPLEAPRPFPASLRPLVRAVTNSRLQPSYTSGPATRAALAAAGALGATTGSVVHLPTAPSSARTHLGVVAHELAHLRYPVSRPRFLLRQPAGGADEDERAALALGRRVQSVASSPDPVAAGIVADLPVGSASGVVEIATQAARAVVHDDGARAEDGTRNSAVSNAGASAAGASGDHDLDGGGPGGAAAQPSHGRAVAEVGSTDERGGGAGVPAGQAAHGRTAGGVDLDQLAEALEGRLLRQIERRGGRYRGVF